MEKAEVNVMRECPGCGQQVRFRAVPALRGQVAYVHMHEPHKAPCGRPCAEGRDVSMQQALIGDVHHPHNCECLREGRGYA